MNLRKGFPILAVFVMAFVTGCEKDDDPGIRPTVISTSPANVATSVATNSKVTATFSAAMDPASITTTQFTVKQGTSAITGAVTYTGTTATFTPASNLEGNKAYTATITTDVKDMAGSTLAENYVFGFTTGTAPDVVAPTVTSTDPLNNATAVALNKAVVIKFSEAMDASTITATTFTLKQGTTSVAGAVTYSGTTATFTPTTTMGNGLIYTATITTGAKDMASNSLAANVVISFATVAGAGPDVLAPTILSTDPLSNATGAARNKAVIVNFSEAMDASTITANTFTLKQGTTSVAGVVTYSGTAATFTPTANLAAGMVYTATITTGAKDAAANALAANTVWSFTTGGTTTATLAPVDLGGSANYVILAKTAISNISTSAVTGDLGLSPAATSYITGLSLTNATGYATSAQVTGKLYAADMAPPTPTTLTTAVNNMITAYTDAAGRPSPDFTELGTGNIGGKTLSSGLYKWSGNVTIPASITISGSATDVWIFQIAGNLSMSSAVNITLTGGALAKNIFWQVAGQVTVGTTAHMEGNILCQTGITFQTGASINGRALAQTAVVLDGNTVTKL